MNPQTLAIIAIAATVLFGVAQVVVSYRPPPRRRSLAYWVVGTRLLGQRAQNVPLEVRVGGELVADPRLVRVHLVAYGRADIPSTAFDQGKGIVVEVNAPIRLVLGAEGVDAENFKVIDSAIEVCPHLMKSGAHYQWDLVCDGPQRSAVSTYLIDTDILDPREAWRRTTKSDWLARGAVLVLAIALLLVGGLNIDWDDKTPDYGWPNWVAGAGLLLAIFGFPLLAVFRVSRESRTAQRLLTKEMNSYLQGSDGFD